MAHAPIGMSADEAMSMLDRSLAIPQLLSGAFDERIEELRAATKEHDAKLEAVGGLDKALQTKADADKYASGVRSDADAIQASAQEKLDAATAKEKDLGDRELALSENLAAFATDSAQTKDALDRRTRQVAGRESAVAMAERSLATAQEQFSADRAALEAEKAKFAAKLKALAE